MATTILPAAYPLVDLGTIGINYSEVLARPASPNVSPKNNPTPYFQFGDVDSFKFALNTQWAKRFTKNRRVSTQSKNVATRVESTVSVKAVQITDFIRMYALLGEQIVMTQAAGTALTYAIPNAVDGIYQLGAYNVTSATASGGVTCTLIDSALGMVMIAGTAGAGATVTVTYACAAYSATKTKSGVVLGQPLEFLVRGVSDSGQKGVLHIFNVPIGPKGDIDFVPANDDFQSVELEGAALQAVDDEGEASLGYWMPLAA